MPDDGYETSLIDLALTLCNRNKHPVAPADATLVEDDEQHKNNEQQAQQLSDYEAQRLQKIRLNQDYLASLGLEPLPPAATNKKKRRKSVREAGGKVVEKRPRSSELKLVVKSQGSAKESKGEAVVAAVTNPHMAMRLSFGHVVTQFERFYPDDDEKSGKRVDGLPSFA